jgi:hypothetical protein
MDIEVTPSQAAPHMPIRQETHLIRSNAKRRRIKLIGTNPC